jgi:hypothetical protein
MFWNSKIKYLLNIHSYHGKGDHFEHVQPWVNFLFIKRWKLLLLLLLLFLSVTHELSAVVRRNHRSNDLGVCYDDKSIYQILHIHSYHGKGDHFEHFQPWVNFFTSQGSFLWSVIIIRLKIYFEHSWLEWEWLEVPIHSDQNIYFSGFYSN